jgi:elongation factor Ts
MSLEITVGMIKDLRDRTGAGIMDCKRALEEADGDSNKAENILRDKGFSDAAKRVGRETNEGVIDAYIHAGARLGALVEVDCETDFVARTEDIKGLAHDLAMQVAAMPSTSYVEPSEVAEDDSRPIQEVVLLEQSFIKDPSRTVNDVVQEVRAKVGENIKIRRFARFALGE